MIIILEKIKLNLKMNYNIILESLYNNLSMYANAIQIL